MDEESKSEGSVTIKKLAKTHMSHVQSLSPYNHNRSQGELSADQVNNGDIPMTEEEVANNIPL